ncbi:hypothetical protein QBC37DRAFT_486972 [Rhypophila decipiens]|uniref:Uncharacterized protein n=1 Tax=Rhypophila decipiens TaxID=261697 RepID=A0AAN7B280_9PEZI|nr:hypothetical protein QBC37DRAFT_486972 [Rhypophila decipiens]
MASSAVSQLFPPLGHPTVIRVIQIRPAPVRASPVFIDIQIIDIEHDHVSFEAFSSPPELLDADADADEDASVVLGGTRFPVRPSVGAALRRLRHATRSRTVFVDEICIREEDGIVGVNRSGLIVRVCFAATRIL